MLGEGEGEVAAEAFASDPLGGGSRGSRSSGVLVGTDRKRYRRGAGRGRRRGIEHAGGGGRTHLVLGLAI